MNRKLWIPALCLTVVAGLACGGGSNSAEPTTAIDTSTPAPGETAAASPDAATATPSEFEELREALIDRLQGFGANIGALPDDIRDDLLAACEDLSAFADAERVGELCSAIEQAIAAGDSGLIDLVVNDLLELPEN